MLFNSYAFVLAFLPVTLAGYLWLQRVRPGGAVAIWFLTLASLFYYGYWNPRYLPLILASMGVNYALGSAMGKAPAGRQRRGMLWAGIAANLAALGYFKYTVFAVTTLAQLFGSAYRPAEIILPLGISFFTFTQIAYLVDVHGGKAREYRFVDYCLFVSFFPHSIAGPIIHHAEMMPQFLAARFRRADVAVGLSFFVLGLGKKVLIADNCAPLASGVFDRAAAGGVLSFFDGWAGALAYTSQLYFDFSGYSDMAIGLARMFGIRFPANFNSPYRATNIIDFWRRWHVTLSRFLRDYIYIPLGGNRHGPWRRYANLLITMLLGGIWHGAGWTFAVWGALHGLCLCINHLWQRWTAPYPLFRARVLRGPAWLVTFLAVVVGWVYFRASNLATAHHILEAMFGGAGLPWAAGGAREWGSFGAPIQLVPNQVVTWSGVVPTFCGLVIAWTLPNSQQLMSSYRPVLQAEGPRSAIGLRLTGPTAIGLALVFAGCLLCLSRVSEFLYYQF